MFTLRHRLIICISPPPVVILENGIDFIYLYFYTRIPVLLSSSSKHERKHAMRSDQARVESESIKQVKPQQCIPNRHLLLRF